MEEAGVDQVHSGVLGAAGVGVYRHPVVVLGRVKRTLGVIRAEVAQVIPAGAHEGVHGVGFAFSGTTANWAGGEAPGGVQLERAFARGQPFYVIWQQYWQLILWNRHSAACGAVNHRNWGAPVALAANEPVVQAVAGGAKTKSIFLSIMNCCSHGFRFRGAGEWPGIDH